jgi:hypothetical protein
MADDAVPRALSRAYEEAGEHALAAADARIIVFSDLHRGTRDGADDHQRSEPAYCAALAWYLEEGYTLYVLGDAEELWENDPEKVLSDKLGYAHALRLEAAFHRAKRYERFFGNHDDDWRHEDAVVKHLHPFMPGLGVREALRLRLTRPGGADGVLFFAHGHQGTVESDRFGWASRLFVRYVWRPIQRKSGYTGVTPSQDHGLRAKHDRAMAVWAGSHPAKPILIAGHTHRPVFWDSTPDPKPAGTQGTTAADRRADEEFARARERNPPTAFTIPTPCYFNTGCCCFGDGDVTGLEIADGELRLVRWPLDDGTPRRKILAARGLDDVLDAVAGHDRSAVAGREVPV